MRILMKPKSFEYYSDRVQELDANILPGINTKHLEMLKISGTQNCEDPQYIFEESYFGWKNRRSRRRVRRLDMVRTRSETLQISSMKSQSKILCLRFRIVIFVSALQEKSGTRDTNQRFLFISRNPHRNGSRRGFNNEKYLQVFI